MNIRELESFLKEKGFVEEKQDSGIIYKIEKDHVELICYIEPGIEVEFISRYRWKNNEVKGTHNISEDELLHVRDSVKVLFKKTKNNLPQYIGEKTDTHNEVEKVIDRIF
ncbi:MAG: hypothetical protein LBV43_06290 [Prevotella sp.]|jgi:hypothetical protein|nr:hypothetical protein [Prevotella sp.]